MLKEDVRVQDAMQRQLEMRFSQAIMEGLAGELHPDRVVAALEKVLASERTIKKSRDAAARSYI
jgi:hypothetical protein